MLMKMGGSGRQRQAVAGSGRQWKAVEGSGSGMQRQAVAGIMAVLPIPITAKTAILTQFRAKKLLYITQFFFGTKLR